MKKNSGPLVQGGLDAFGDHGGDGPGHADRGQGDALKTGAGQGVWQIFGHMLGAGCEKRQADGAGGQVAGRSDAEPCAASLTHSPCPSNAA